MCIIIALFELVYAHEESIYMNMHNVWTRRLSSYACIYPNWYTHKNVPYTYSMYIC